MKTGIPEDTKIPQKGAAAAEEAREDHSTYFQKAKAPCAVGAAAAAALASEKVQAFPARLASSLGRFGAFGRGRL
eukprot:7418969-Alexandrium_andersonii.AAC.1